MFNIFKCKHRGNYWMQQIGIWTTFFLYGQNYFSAAIKPVSYTHLTLPTKLEV